MKHLKSIFLTIIIVLSTGIFTLATNQENTITMTIGSTEAVKFGQTVTNDVAPMIYNGRTMLPARFVAESLGAKVGWDDTQKRVTITKDDIVIVLTVGSDLAYVNNEAKKLDSKVFIQNGRTYTPVRFVAEVLGASVKWEGKTKQVILNKNGYVVNQVSYNKPVENHSYRSHEINIPMLTGETQNITDFNKKIKDNTAKFLKQYYGDAKVCTVDYTYNICNGIVKINVDTNVVGIGSSAVKRDVQKYCYDTNADRELSANEYSSIVFWR